MGQSSPHCTGICLFTTGQLSRFSRERTPSSNLVYKGGRVYPTHGWLCAHKFHVRVFGRGPTFAKTPAGMPPSNYTYREMVTSHLPNQQGQQRNTSKHKQNISFVDIHQYSQQNKPVCCSNILPTQRKMAERAWGQRLEPERSWFQGWAANPKCGESPSKLVYCVLDFFRNPPKQ